MEEIKSIQTGLQNVDTESELRFIFEREPKMAEAIRAVIHHISGTYKDKYNDNEKGGEDFLNTKKMLYNGKGGAYINTYQVCRYLQRYMSTGFEKSNLIKDLLKSVHYILFEIVRRMKIEGYDVIADPKEPKF